MIFVRLFFGWLLATAVGLAALRGKQWYRRVPTALDLALGALAGLAITTLSVFLLALLGLPIRGRGIILLQIFLATGLSLLPLSRAARRRSARPESGALARVSSIVLWSAFGVSAFKWFRVALWSSDHNFVWGLKAKRVLENHLLDFGFLRLRAFDVSVTHYPVGLPLAWRVLAPGAVPDETVFRVCHFLFALCVVLLLREGIRGLGASHALANALASFAAVSPLFWDTEALGLAEIVLVCFGLASLVSLMKLSEGSPIPSWLVGLLIGFMSWIKHEGILLAALVLLAGVLFAGRGGDRRFGALPITAAVAAAVALAALLFHRFVLPQGFKVLSGDWLALGRARAEKPFKILEEVSAELLRPEWLGFWPLFFLLVGVAFVRRKKTAAVLGAVVLGQLAGYIAFYFFTGLDPLEHLQNSLFRISAGLLPLALLAVGALFGGRQPSQASRGARVSRAT